MVGRATEWIASIFHRFEEQMVFKAVGQGIVATSHRLGTRLSQVERLLRRSWWWVAAMVGVLAIIVAAGEILHRQGSDDFPLLSALLVVPLVGIIADYRDRQARSAFALGLTVAGVELGLALYLVARFDPHAPGMQFVERVEIFSWLPYHVGVDGVGVLFLPLTALLTLLSLIHI